MINSKSERFLCVIWILFREQFCYLGGCWGGEGGENPSRWMWLVKLLLPTSLIWRCCRGDRSDNEQFYQGNAYGLVAWTALPQILELPLPILFPPNTCPGPVVAVSHPCSGNKSSAAPGQQRWHCKGTWHQGQRTCIAGWPMLHSESLGSLRSSSLLVTAFSFWERSSDEAGMYWYISAGMSSRMGSKGWL